MEGLAPLGAVGELEEAGECAPVFATVEEDGVLKIHAVGEDVVVLIHPAKGDKQRGVKESRSQLFFGVVIMVDLISMCKRAPLSLNVRKKGIKRVKICKR